MQFVTGERVAKAIHKASYFFSFLIGLGISVLIFQDMVDKVVKLDGKCYKYRVEDASCETSSST